MPSTLVDWLTYLESLHPKAIALGLERVDEVRRRMNMAPDFPLIIVGGTNGKGSVCAMLESILHAAGYRVGCYTSPHLLHYNERVRIAKQAVSDDELCASFEKIERARVGRDESRQNDSLTPTLGEQLAIRLGGQKTPARSLVISRWERGKSLKSESFNIPLTYFEFGTLAAMQLFVEHKVEVAILEVGLGGRLDAVNMFDADCAVVTSVDIDHTDYLGDTREAIAFEKAGIFRRDRVAIFSDSEVPQSLVDHAASIGAKLQRIGREFGFTPHQGQWDYRSKAAARTALPHPALRGAFQLNNASAVLAALDAIRDRLPVSMEAVRRGLTEVQLAGRFQFVPGKSQLILDVAHNPHAARALAQNLDSLPPCPHTYAVFAMLKDKDMAGVAEVLNPYIDTWLVAGIDAPRGARSDELAGVLHQAGVRGEVICFAETAHALTHACNVAGENDRIITFGSFYTVAEAMRAKGVSAA